MKRQRQNEEITTREDDSYKKRRSQTRGHKKNPLTLLPMVQSQKQEGVKWYFQVDQNLVMGLLSFEI